MNTSSELSEIFVGAHMDEPVYLAVPGGEVAVFGRASPDKATGNEDSMAVVADLEFMTVLVVADGLGGSREGQIASAITVRKLSEAIRKAADERSSPRAAILNGLETANEEILATATGSATTAIVACIVGGFLRTYHVGDSGLIQVGQRGLIKQQTVAHSPVGFAEASGMLSEEEALHHAERHLVSNTIGIADMSIEVGPNLAIDRRDTVLLASDGVFDNLRVDEITECIRKGSLEDVAQRLQRLAQERMHEQVTGQPSKPDDLSFILYRRTR